MSSSTTTTQLPNVTQVSTEAGSEGTSAQHIAAITITSVFVFYLAIMVIVCLGEYCQYIKGKKGRPAQRSTHQKSTRRGNSQSTTTSKSTSRSPYDYSNSQPSDMSSVTHQQPVKSSQHFGTDQSKDVTERTAQEESVPKEVSVNSDVQMSFEESLKQFDIDCVETCDSPYIKGSSEQEIAMVPLISRQCSEIQSEILCDDEELGTLSSTLEVSV